MDLQQFKSGASATPPSASEAVSSGYPTAGNAGLGIPATKPGPYLFYQIDQEFRALLAAAGLSSSKTTLTQLRDSVLALSAAAAGAAAGHVKSYAVTKANALNTAVETDIATFTVGANEWGDNEYILLQLLFAIKNNKGSAGTFSPKAYVGGVSTSLANATQGDGATEQVVATQFLLHRSGSAVYLRKHGSVGTIPAETTIGELTYADMTSLTANQFTHPPFTPTFTGNIIVKISVTPSAADPTFYVKSFAAFAHKFGA
jgi:hypothetical protein